MKKSGILISFMISFFVFLFCPLEFYWSNKSEFFFSVYDFIYILIFAFLVSFVTMTAIYYVLGRVNDSVAEAILCIGFFLCIGMYIQGNYIPSHIGPLDGSKIDWSKYSTDRFLSVVLWVVLVILIVFSVSNSQRRKKWRKIASIVAPCLVILWFTTLLIISISSDGFKKSELNVVTKRNEFDMSSKQNIIVLIVDSLDSKAFDKVLDNYNQKDFLDGFTYYRNTSGMYLYTELAVPYIISGLEYDPHEDYKDYLCRVYSIDSMLCDMQKEGYELNLYLSIDEYIGDPDVDIKNYEKAELTVSSHKVLIELLYKLVGYRYLPFDLKRFCWFYPDDINNLRSIAGQNGSDEVYDWDNYIFYDDIANMKVATDAPSLHIYHIKGPHMPYYMTADFTESASETSIYEETQGMLVLIDRFIDKIKETGIYDNSSIIIMSDHGVLGERQAPTLLVKNNDENETLVINDIPTSYADLSMLFDMVTSNRQPVMERHVGRRFIYRNERDYSISIDNQKFSLIKYSVGENAFDDDSVVLMGNEE